MSDNCKECGDPKIMYYREWCPRCEKPERATVETLNLIETMYHIDRVIYDETNQNVDPPGKDELWCLMSDYNYIKNDTYVSINFSDWCDDIKLDDNYSNEMKEYMRNIVKEFDITGSIVWNISW